MTNVVLGTGYLVLVNPSMPELPTMREQGVANLEVTGSWHGWLAPAKTPAAILARVHREVRIALQVPRLREAIVSGGYEPDGRGPAEFRTFLRQEFDGYGEMVKVANVPRE